MTAVERARAQIRERRTELLLQRDRELPRVHRLNRAYAAAIDGEHAIWRSFEEGKASLEEWRVAMAASEDAFTDLALALATANRIDDRLKELDGPRAMAARVAQIERLDALHAGAKEGAVA